VALSKPKIPVGGLAQGPNDLDKPAGDFLVAENVVHRRTNILEPMLGETKLFPDVAPLKQPARIFSDWTPSYAIRVTKQDSNAYGLLEYGPFDAISDPTTYSPAHFQPGRTQCVYVDGRHILSGAQYNVVAENIDETSHAAPRRAGMPQISGISIGSGTPTAGTAYNPVILANKVYAYTAIVRRKVVGDRFIYSAPCSKVTTLIQPNDFSYQFVLAFETAYDNAGTVTFEEGDELLLFRTKAADSVAEINDTFYLALVYPIVAADLTNKYAIVRDSTLETNLGEELYTNPGQEGSLKANIIPPCSSGVEAFNGTTFYINHNAQPTRTATVVGAFGNLPTVISDATRQQRQNGIGTRFITGDTSIGSPNITNVIANDRVGLAVGQLAFFAPGFPLGVYEITAITGAGPYTVTLNANAIAAVVGASFRMLDSVTVVAVKDGVTLTSQPAGLGSLDGAQFQLRDLVDLSSNAMRGFNVNSGSPANIFSGSVYDEKVQLNFSVTSPDQWDSFTLKLTNPANWVEGNVTGSTYKELESVQETRKNVVWYSKPNQPEHVAPIQFFLVGTGICYRLLNTQSTMLAFCSDGIFKIDGEGDNWFITPVDSTARLVHPDAAVASSTQAFAWLESGMAVCSETNVDIISRDAIGPDLGALVKTLSLLTDGPRYIWGPQMAIDRLNNEVWLNIVYLPLLDADREQYACYVFNTQTAKFTTCSTFFSALCYFPPQLELLKGKLDGLYGDTGYTTDYKQATVIYLPVVDNAGEVKQWIDVNYYFDEVPTISSDTYVVEALFGGETTSSTNSLSRARSGAPTNMFALHSLVPRRCARDVELTFGFKTTTTVDAEHPSGGYYFQFKGASVRVRRASQVIKR